MIVAIVFFFYALLNSTISAEDIENIGNNVNNNTQFIINNTPRTKVPKTAYQRELVRYFYRSEIVDPLGYYMELYRIFQTNERYFIYWYLTYCDVVTSSEPWTEESIYKECLHMNIQYLVNIVLAAKEHFPEFSSDWVPPANYLNSKPWHPWLQYGPNFYGVIPPQLVTEAAINGIVENAGPGIQKLQVQAAYYHNEFKTPYQTAIFNRYRMYPVEIFDQVYRIFNTNERHLLYWYVNYCDLAIHSKPWDELRIHKTCLAVADPQFIIEVVNAGKTHISGFNESWQPPANYLVEKIWHPWLSYAPNFTGITPEEMAIRYHPRNANERALLTRFYLHGDKATFEHIFHIFYTNERHLLYQYVLYYDPVMLGKEEWTEERLFQICLKLDPQFIINVVTAAKSYLPDFNSEWQPDPDYLEFRQWEPWMAYGPYMIFSRGYVFGGLMIVFMFFSAGFWSMYQDEA